MQLLSCNSPRSVGARMFSNSIFMPAVMFCKECPCKEKSNLPRLIVIIVNLRLKQERVRQMLLLF